MPPEVNAELHRLSRQQWLRVISDVCLPEMEHGVKRRSRRYALEFGEARIVFRREDHPDGAPVMYSVPILQVSADGLMLKGHKSLPIDTELAMELNLGAKPCVVLGAVAHCTETVGGYKLGVTIRFP